MPQTCFCGYFVGKNGTKFEIISNLVGFIFHVMELSYDNLKKKEENICTSNQSKIILA